MYIGVPLCAFLTFSSSRVTVTTEDQESDEIGEEASTPDNENQFGVINLRGFNESSNSLEDDRDT